MGNGFLELALFPCLVCFNCSRVIFFAEFEWQSFSFDEGFNLDCIYHFIFACHVFIAGGDNYG